MRKTKTVPKIIAVEHAGRYVLRVRLSDGQVVYRDFRRLVGKGVFASLLDVEEFKKVAVEGGRLTWHPVDVPHEVDVDTDNTIWGHYPHAANEMACEHAIVDHELVCLKRTRPLGKDN